METKLTAGLALIAAVLTHHLSLAIVDHTRAFNASSVSGLSLRMISIHGGPGYSTHRGSDGFLYLKHNLSSSVANITVEPEVDSTRIEVPMRVGTGEARQDYTLKVDTTSRLTWLQCEPCVPHAPQEGPLYNPMRSPTYRSVAGSDKSCTPEHGMEPAGVHCAFHVAGPGGMSVHGYVAREHIMDLETNIISPDFILGCAHSTENFASEGEYAGITTLSQAPASLAMQLAARGLTQFSYCLTGGSSRHGFLRFGTDVPPNPQYQDIRILPTPDANNSAAYYIDLVGVSLGMHRLNMIRPETFARSKDGQGGTIIDLGTPLTVMAEEAYRVVEEAAWSRLKELGAERVERHRYGLCAHVTKAAKGHLPSLSLHFANEEEATLVVSPEQLFLIMDDEHAGQIACLAIVPGRRTIIGALQQVDTRFVFDLKDSKILFAPESCIKDTVQDV